MSVLLYSKYIHEILNVGIENTLTFSSTISIKCPILSHSNLFSFLFSPTIYVDIVYNCWLLKCNTNYKKNMRYQNDIYIRDYLWYMI